MSLAGDEKQTAEGCIQLFKTYASAQKSTRASLVIYSEEPARSTEYFHTFDSCSSHGAEDGLMHKYSSHARHHAFVINSVSIIFPPSINNLPRNPRIKCVQKRATIPILHRNGRFIIYSHSSEVACTISEVLMQRQVTTATTDVGIMYPRRSSPVHTNVIAWCDWRSERMSPTARSFDPRFFKPTSLKRKIYISLCHD